MTYTNAVQHCDKTPTPACINETMGYLRRIEEAFYAGFQRGPHFHVIGNHDVDILNQSEVFDNEHDTAVPGMAHGGDGYYAWSWPAVATAAEAAAVAAAAEEAVTA